jgi:hypothetical protein
LIERFCDWLSATPISVAFQSVNWFVPLVQSVHIISISILLTSVYVVSFRLIRPSTGAQPVATVAARLAPWIWTSLCVLLVTGTLLTITEPARELLNWVFRTKLLLVLLLTGTWAGVQLRLRRSPEYWSQSPARRRAARAVGLLCVAIGACIVIAGRWIAYV